MRLPTVVCAVAVLASVPGSAFAQADDPACRIVQFDFTPADDLQLVVWIEDDQGNYIDTAFITQATGTYGIGNRPGMMEFNSAWAWPYGRRTTTFPVWAHRHGMSWPKLEFQNADDTNLSHPLAQSSRESLFCRPLKAGETAWDTETCASIVYTDKGTMSSTESSLYPPRADHGYVSGTDSADVLQFPGMNPFDSVSRATPVGSELFRIVYSLPEGLPDGNYVAFVEANREFDQNEFYDFPSPVGIPWSEYGLAYRGQPSVVYSAPFTLGPDANSAVAESYAGYGDPEGLDGNIREPDGTITESIDGSGASRLLVTVDGTDTFRFRVVTTPTEDTVGPAAPADFVDTTVLATEVHASFVAPGNDGLDGTAAGYDVRMRVGEEITEANFASSAPANVSLVPAEAGTVQELVFTNLQPNTNYYFAIRAYDECLNTGPIAALHVLTPRREAGEVDACFIATAAYGSVLQSDVAKLRKFRDVALRTNVPGELAVVGYYTFGPALASVIRPSDTLREFARAALAPVVSAAKRAL